MTLLCVPIMVTEIDAALADCAEAKRLGAQIVEYRIDQIFSGSPEGSPLSDTDAALETREIERLIRSSPLPAIVTCRPTFEGGFYDGDDSSRVSLYQHLGGGGNDAQGLTHPPRYIDVEFATLSRSANIRQKVLLAVDHPNQPRGLETGLILSAHDFEKRPSDLTRRLLAMRAESAAKVIKVAFRARSLRDNLELFDILREADRPTIALGMGEFGLMSRVLAPKFGAFLTFASLRDASATAPGQPTITEILQRYRFRSISRSTRVYGVIGWPVGHSLSPLIHNAGFESVGHDAVYLPLPVAAEGVEADGGAYESFKATLLDLIDHPGLDFSGASVTIPHKEHLVRLARDQGNARGWTLTPAAAAIGAANTIDISRHADGTPARITIDNTDAPAVAACLRDEVGEVGDLKGRTIAILGAGGVARAAAYAAASESATVAIYARTTPRAEQMVADLAPHVSGTLLAMDWESRHQAHADAFINCTPMGMRGGAAPDDSPIEPGALTGCDASEVVYFDTVYNPIRTRMLTLAEDAGATRLIDGASMFVRQGAMQFTMWTGMPAPIEMFDRLVRARLGQ
jgi:3-dehydroquinate dehydratase/shikimate dehydrogenase